ncbi:hypothetical protein WN943_005859 [Citrus x changshan-huyou]
MRTAAGLGMENYLNENFGSVKPKNSSEEALQRWRRLYGIVKNPKRIFPFTANLAKRSEAEAIRRSNQEEIRVAVNVQLAAHRFMEKKELEDVSSSEYTVSEAAEFKNVYKLLGKCKKHTIAVLPLVGNLFTYLVLEGTSFVVYLLGYLVSEVISSFNLVLWAISDIQDLVKKSKWSFLLGFGIAVCACILARATAATRQEFERQLIGAVEIVFSVIQWMIKYFYFSLADLGVNSNYSALVLLLLFSIATLFLLKKDENATDSSHVTYNISSRNLSISHVPSFHYVPRTANRFLLLIIQNVMNQLNLVKDLHLISSPAPLMASAACQVCQLLGKHKKCSLAVFYLVLEAASFKLDLFGKNKRDFLLALVLLSAFGFAMCTYTCIRRRSRGATRVQSQKQLVRTVEVAFSEVQLIVTLVYFILAELHVKNNFSVSVFPLVFAVIVAVFTF